MRFNRIKTILNSGHTNYKGWKTNKKIIVIESDDWGSIRMPSREVYNYCIKKGYHVDKTIYTKYDSLESEEDLDMLLNLLIRIKDKNGQHPIFTANCLVANPDFSRIKASDFSHYYYESFLETYKKYPKHQKNWQKWQNAIKENLLFPQSHGREHLNVSRYLSDLQNRNYDAHFSFELQMPGIFEKNNHTKGNKYIVPLEYYNEKDKKGKMDIIKEGLKTFETIFNYKSESYIAGNFVWYSEIENVLNEAKIKFIQGGKYQLLPKGKYEGYVTKRHFIGEANNYGQKYLIRNVFFEPSFDNKIDWVNRCLKEISIAYLMGRPAIISTHRINYIGTIEESNRDRSLFLLNELLYQIKRKWPETQFMTSVELGSYINNNLR